MVTSLLNKLVRIVKSPSADCDCLNQLGYIMVVYQSAQGGIRLVVASNGQLFDVAPDYVRVQ